MATIPTLVLLLSIVLGTALVSAAADANDDPQHPPAPRVVRIGVVPKPNSVSNEFFKVIEEGCRDRAREVTQQQQDGNNNNTVIVECLYAGAEARDASEQARVIRNMIEDQKVDGIAISVSDEATMTATINSIIEDTNGTVPVITYDSDASESKRQAFIATDNFAFGVELGKVLDQLYPNCNHGKYGIIAAPAPNLIDRVEGVRNRLGKTRWSEVGHSPTDCRDNSSLAIEQMYGFASDPEIEAIIPVGSWPMMVEKEFKEFVEAYPNLTIVCGDSFDVQLGLMNRGYVNGLVGQLPFQMGTMVIDTVLDLLGGNQPEEVITGTAVLEVLRFPLNLPPLIVNKNQIGNLSILAYCFVPIIVLASLGLVAWILVNWNHRVVLASQPIFLILICAGVLTMGTAILPLSMDDEKHSQASVDMACVAHSWLLAIGFSLVFAALFSKTWRVNQLFHNPQRYKRIKVEVKDVLGPLVCIMAINTITLTCWTSVSPAKYVREDLPGTDEWNRAIASYGTCRPGSKVFPIILMIVNVGVLIVANVQAYQARSIETEFSESKYISIIMASLLQSAVLGIPIIILTGDQPRTTFVVMATTIFLLSMVILGFIFVPKVRHLRRTMLRESQKKNSNNTRVHINSESLKKYKDIQANTESKDDSNKNDTNSLAFRVKAFRVDATGNVIDASTGAEEQDERSKSAKSSNNNIEYLSSREQLLFSMLRTDLGIDLSKFLVEEENDDSDDVGDNNNHHDSADRTMMCSSDLEGAETTVVGMPSARQLSALKKELLGKLR